MYIQTENKYGDKTTPDKRSTTKFIPGFVNWEFANLIFYFTFSFTDIPFFKSNR